MYYYVESVRVILIMIVLRILLALSVALAAAPAVSSAANHHVKNRSEVTTEQAEDITELLISLNAGTDAARFAQEHGLTLKYGLQSEPNSYVFATESSARAKELSQGMEDSRVASVYLNRLSQNVSSGFVSNDPLFSPTGSFAGQWTLRNQIGTGIDANLKGAWDKGVTGQGVTIGIVDDCLQWAHPDLQPNYSAENSYNFGSYVSSGTANDPSPVNSDDRHGTSVAGVAAARGNNGIGVTGAAPYACLAGLRVDFDDQTTAQFVDATLYHSSGSNTTIQVKNHSYGVSLPFIKDGGTVAERNALYTSTQAGTIHCFAAGNDRDTTGEDSNKKYMQSSPDAIAVAAVGSSGVYASYSNYGANVFISAPSNGSTYGVTTTDVAGSGGYNDGSTSTDYSNADYTSTFGGTSAATPLVAGVLALAKQVQPNLDTRFAKHLLARTSTKVDAADSSISGGGDGVTSGSAWRSNAAGYQFNENYGFGLINAGKLVEEATRYSSVTSLQTVGTGTMAVGEMIPDDDSTGLVRTADIHSKTPLEEILVTLSITHTYRGDLEGWLTSPLGTTSRLFASSNDGGDDINWQFTGNAFWGEDPYGVWLLKVDDTAAADTGMWVSWALDLRMGELVIISEPGTAVAAATALAMFLLWHRRRGPMP